LPHDWQPLSAQGRQSLADRSKRFSAIVSFHPAPAVGAAAIISVMRWGKYLADAVQLPKLILLTYATLPTAPRARYDADKRIPWQGFRGHNAAQNKSALLMESRHVITSHHHRAPRPEIPLL
jgi:hypothetical protein